MLFSLPRAVLVFFYLPLYATAAPNQRRSDDGSYGGADSDEDPMYYAQTTTPNIYGMRPEATASSTLQTLPNTSPFPYRGGASQQDASAGNGYGGGYGLGSSSIGRYPLYNSTAPYGSRGAWLAGTATGSPAIPLPSFESHYNAASISGYDQACSQSAGYAATTSTQTVTTVVTDTQTVTTVVTDTQTVTTVVTSTSMVMSTSTITAFVTLTTTSTVNQGTGLVPSKANEYPNPTTEASKQGISSARFPGATYPHSGIPASMGNHATIPGSLPPTTVPTQPQPNSAAYVPSVEGYGSGGLPVPSVAAPFSEPDSNFSLPTNTGLPTSRPANPIDVSQEMYPTQQPIPSLSGGISAPGLFPMTGGVPGVVGSIPASGIRPVPSQQQSGNSYNVPVSNAPITSLAGGSMYPIQSHVADPAVSTGVNPYQSQYEGPGPQLPTSLPPYTNSTQNDSSVPSQPIITSPFNSYPIGTSLAGSGGVGFPGTGGTTTMLSTYHVIPVPATSAPSLPEYDTHLAGSSNQTIYPPNNMSSTTCTTDCVTNVHEPSDLPTIPIASVSNPYNLGHPTQSMSPAVLNTSIVMPLTTSLPQDTDHPLPSTASTPPLYNANSSLPIVPQATLPPVIPSIPATNLAPSQPPSIPPTQSTCSPSITTITANNFQHLPPNTPLPLPYLGLNYTTLNPSGSPPYNHLLSSSVPKLISIPSSPDTSQKHTAGFTLLSLLLFCRPQPETASCIVDINGLSAPSSTTTGAAAGGIARMSINVPPFTATGAGNGTVMAVNGTVPGVNGGRVSVGDGNGVGVPVAFTGLGWTRLQSVGFVATVGGRLEEGGGDTGVGVDELVYELVEECGA